MKASINVSKILAGNSCFEPGETRIRAIKWAILLIIVSILFVGLPLVGFGTADPLTPEERAWLEKHDGKIIVNREAGWPPIIDTDKDGNSFGIVMDYQRLIEKKLNFKFKPDKLDSWKNFMERFRKGKIDVNNNLQKNPKRTKYALFTKPYIEIPNAIIVRKENKNSLTLEKMRGMKIAVTNDFAIHDYIKDKYDYIQLTPLDSDLNCLLETSTRNVDAAVVNLAVASFIIEKMGISNLRVAGYTEYKNALCFASRKDWPILNRILDKGLNLITRAERDAIYGKWISLGDVPFYKNRNFWIVACSVTIIIIAFILMILVWNRSLKRQVELRTEKLKTINVRLKNEIDDREQAEEALRESEDKYRDIFNNAQVGIFRTRISDGKVLECNDRFARTYGYKTPEECVDNFVVSDHYADPGVREKMLDSLMEKGEVHNLEACFSRKDGKDVWIRFSAHAYPEEGYLEGVGYDITEEKQALENLRKSAKEYKRLMENALIGMYKVEKHGEFITVNRKMAEMFGYDSPENFISSVDNIVDLYVRPEERSVTLRNIDTEGSVAGKDVEFRKKDGERFWVKYFVRMFEDTGKIIYEGFMEDITESIQAEKKRIDLEDQLQQSQKMEAIGTLAGGIAHDFNNILAIILGNAELASDDVPDSNPASQSLKEIRRASIRAKDIVHQLLAFSRKADEESKPIDLAPIIKESMKMLRSAIPTSVEFKEHISDDPCSVMGDAAQINQIVMNLVTNAADAMSEEGGLLDVALEDITLQEEKVCFDWVLPPGPYVRLKVRDTGEGIEPKIMDRIFEPYYTTKEVGRGTGMGLSVIHGIVKRHGGGIRVESELGTGTLFEIYFPALEETAEEEKKPDGEIKGGTERILFVDDEASMVDLNQQRLERLGYDVRSSTKPVEALEWFNTDPDQFDVIITDMTMPRMTGDRLAVEVLKIRPHMPVIICTGYSERMSAEKAEALGVRKYIEKPIDLRNLASALREVLDEK